jgi:hypothetical protein
MPIGSNCPSVLAPPSVLVPPSELVTPSVLVTLAKARVQKSCGGTDIFPALDARLREHVVASACPTGRPA